MIVGALAVVACAYVATVSPYAGGAYPVCPLLALTGRYCAGCGGLRATYSLLHLDLAGAWAMNPLLVLAGPLLVWAWARWLWRTMRGAPPSPASATPAAGTVARVGPTPWIVLGVLVAFSVLRNVPALAPLLAP